MEAGVVPCSRAAEASLKQWLVLANYVGASCNLNGLVCFTFFTAIIRGMLNIPIATSLHAFSSSF